MAKIYNLSFLLDTDGYKRIDLVRFYELSKLDDFIMNRFKNNKDVRRKYDTDIGEFCLDNRRMIQEENKRNKHNWTGSIAIICEERNDKDEVVSIHKIPIIYMNDHKLLSKENCLEIIKDKLNDFGTILQIYHEKRFLLSQNEIDLINLYDKMHKKNYLKSSIGFFYNRLKRMDDESLYYYCRTLMNLFKLNKLTIKTNFGTIGNISDSFPSESVIVKKSGYGKDAYLDKLIDEEEYDELFNLYSIDEIDHNSDWFEEGKRKK